MRTIIASVLLIATAACGGDSGTNPTNANIAGSYALQTVNGSALPFVVAQTGQNKIELLNETIVVSDAGTFTQQGTARSTINGAVTTAGYADAGTWVRNGTAVTFRFNSDGSSGTGTVANGTITVGFEGFSYIYSK